MFVEIIEAIKNQESECLLEGLKLTNMTGVVSSIYKSLQMFGFFMLSILEEFVDDELTWGPVE